MSTIKRFLELKNIKISIKNWFNSLANQFFLCYNFNVITGGPLASDEGQERLGGKEEKYNGFNETNHTRIL